jgi:hypothetical protein
MSPELENRIYEDVLRSVMWGAKREEIFHMLTVNGITGDAAEQMYRRARSERIAVLRGEGIRRAVKGALILGAACALFSAFWFGAGAITKRLLVICGLFGAWGAWWLLDGILGALMASTKTGSIASESH